MSQWGTSDAASNSVLWAPTSVRLAPTRTNANLMFGNTTLNAFTAGQRVGVYGVDATELNVQTGGLATASIIYAGSGYTGNVAVTVSGNGTANATANTTGATTKGRITAINISSAGSGYTSNPTVTVAAPANTAFNASTAVAANGAITLSSANTFQVNDPVTYRVATGNTAVASLTSGTTYFVQAANATAIYLATTPGGAVITLTPGSSETGHGLQGNTATAAITVAGGETRGVAHTGWVMRTEGTGGRAGRVSYEVLVAGSMSSDASDDSILPDS